MTGVADDEMTIEFVGIWQEISRIGTQPFGSTIYLQTFSSPSLLLKINQFPLRLLKSQNLAITLAVFGFKNDNPGSMSSSIDASLLSKSSNKLCCFISSLLMLRL